MDGRLREQARSHKGIGPGNTTPIKNVGASLLAKRPALPTIFSKNTMLISKSNAKAHSPISSA